MARIINSRCVLAVRNLEVSTRYYLDTLGFRKDPVEDKGWSFLTRDYFRVMLGECVDKQAAGKLGSHSCYAYRNVGGADDAGGQAMGAAGVWLGHTGRTWNRPR